VRTAGTALERVAIVAASLALSVALIALLSGYFAGHDPADVSGPAAGPGKAYRDLGDAALKPGQPRPAYDSSPPTSGAHRPEAVTRDDAPLNDDQLLQALQAGDVVLMYGAHTTPPGLRALSVTLAPPFSPALAASGQAVILARRTGIHGAVGLAWSHMIRVADARDPSLRAFAAFWLGRGAPSG